MIKALRCVHVPKTSTENLPQRRCSPSRPSVRLPFEPPVLGLFDRVMLKAELFMLCRCVLAGWKRWHDDLMSCERTQTVLEDMCTCLSHVQTEAEWRFRGLIQVPQTVLGHMYSHTWQNIDLLEWSFQRTKSSIAGTKQETIAFTVLKMDVM